MMPSIPISKGLNDLTKQQHRQSDDSLPLSSISQYRDQLSTNTGKADEYTLRVDEIRASVKNSNHNIVGDGSWLNSANDAANPFSSTSSVYSSSEEPNIQRHSTTTDSETSARSSSMVSQNQGSTKSIASSVGVTSVSNYSQESTPQPEQQNQNQKRQNDRVKHTLSFSSLRNRNSIERNPLEWLCRGSDASLRQSSQPKVDQRVDLENYYHKVIQNSDVESDNPQTQKLQAIPADLGAVIAERMERLEDKIDILFSTASKPTSTDGSSIAYQAMFDANDSSTLEEEQPSQNANSQTSLHAPRKQHTENTQQPQLNILIAEISHLIKSNNKLSSCIDALGSSGLIDLLEMLSCSLERLHSAINSLREQQNLQQSIISEQASHILKQRENGNDDEEEENNRQQQQQQLELQMDIIQRLGRLLGQREEQLRHERKLNESYRENIEGLEEMIRALEVEWEKTVPLISHSEGVTDCIRKLSRNGIIQ